MVDELKTDDLVTISQLLPCNLAHAALPTISLLVMGASVYGIFGRVFGCVWVCLGVFGWLV